jgi:two-component system C4-dicarboxylate transport sensor histidine kinase DctB
MEVVMIVFEVYTQIPSLKPLSRFHLISFVEEIGAASLVLLDTSGRTVAATDRNRLGENHRQAASFVEAMRSNATVFTVESRESAGYSFTYSL